MNLKQSLVKTRKEHQCFGCAKTYPAGSKMWSIAGIHDGDFWSGYWCLICTEVMDGLDYYEKEEGFELGQILEFYKEEYEEAAQTQEARHIA